jgi:hypothetical protein
MRWPCPLLSFLAVASTTHPFDIYEIDVTTKVLVANVFTYCRYPLATLCGACRCLCGSKGCSRMRGDSARGGAKKSKQPSGKSMRETSTLTTDGGSVAS